MAGIRRRTSRELCASALYPSMRNRSLEEENLAGCTSATTTSTTFRLRTWSAVRGLPSALARPSARTAAAAAETRTSRTSPARPRSRPRRTRSVRPRSRRAPDHGARARALPRRMPARAGGTIWTSTASAETGETRCRPRPPTPAAAVIPDRRPSSARPPRRALGWRGRTGGGSGPAEMESEGSGRLPRSHSPSAPRSPTSCW